MSEQNGKENMKAISCPKCKKAVCWTDGEKICFALPPDKKFAACIWIRGRYEDVECGCQKAVVRVIKYGK